MLYRRSILKATPTRPTKSGKNKDTLTGGEERSFWYISQYYQDESNIQIGLLNVGKKNITLFE